MLEQALRVAETARSAPGNVLQGSLLHGDALALTDVMKLGQQNWHGGTPEIEPLAPRKDSIQKPVRLCGAQDKDHMRGWLLQRLEQRIGSLLGEHVNFIDHIHLISSLVRDKAHPLPQLADLVDPPVGSGIDLHQVQRPARANRCAHVAHIAGWIVRLTRAIHRLGHDARHGGLAGSAEAREQVGMPNATGADLVLQRGRDVILAEHIIKRLAAPTVVESLGAHSEVSFAARHTCRCDTPRV